jgi:hypothetical protein
MEEKGGPTAKYFSLKISLMISVPGASLSAGLDR